MNRPNRATPTAHQPEPPARRHAAVDVHHVAILREPYLSLVVSGEKRVEARITQRSIAPFRCVEKGERVYLKKSGGPYHATATVQRAEFWEFDQSGDLQTLRSEYGHLIHGTEEFWASKSRARVATLVWLSDIEPTDDGPDLSGLPPAARRCAWHRFPSVLRRPA
ncbi:MAG: ASCH domain-containing protein [Planctomycetota bacterium]